MEKMKTIGITLGGIVALIVLLIIGSMTTVPTGHAGIKTRFGAVQNDIISEGLNFKVPFVEDIKIKENLKPYKNIFECIISKLYEIK